MYACLFVPADAGGGLRGQELLDLALEFSPVVEQTASDTVVFSIAPLEKLFGTPHQLASEIGRYGYERNLRANLSIAANPDTAVLLARHYPGVTFALLGHEAEKLGPIPLAHLFTHDVPVDPVLLEVLERWGLKTCEELAALPERGVVERLGMSGVYLRNLALGRVDRPLRVTAEETSYEECVHLDYALETLEPLLFLFGRVLSDLCGKLRSQSRAARVLQARLMLAAMTESDSGETKPVPSREFVCELEFPVPLDESRTMLKLLQLHLERHGPEAPVIGFVLHIEPVAPRRVQGGLFLPPNPAPDKLQVTLARIAAMVGEGNVGSPELLNTHRPDAFRMAATVMDGAGPGASDARQSEYSGSGPRLALGQGFSSKDSSRRVSTLQAESLRHDALSQLRLALRIFRPALYARVKTAGVAPKAVIASGVEGEVVEAAGPWRMSGNWWTDAPWSRDEWDVELNDGALYRIYCESKTREWYVAAMYD